MQFIKGQKSGRWGDAFYLATMAAIVVIAAGCTSSGPVKMEAASVAERMELRNCRISIPMSPGEAVELGRKWELYPNPEKDPEWAKMMAMQQPGDELRLVSCSVGDPYFYALVRNNTVIFKYRLPVLD